MGIVLKVNKEDDLYCVWSTIADSPVTWGTEDYIIKYLIDDSRHRLNVSKLREIADGMDRAYRTGTSARDLDGSWEDAGFIYDQGGFLRREDLGKFLLSYDYASYKHDLSILKPFEDDS